MNYTSFGNQQQTDQRGGPLINVFHNVSLDDGQAVPFPKPERRSTSTHEYDLGAQKALESGQIMSQVIGQIDKNKSVLHNRVGSTNDATLYNNKIIINQQHYFTDSIKIYQNDKKDQRAVQVQGREATM